MKLLIDMNLSPLWVQFLADSGFAGLHWSNVVASVGAIPNSSEAIGREGCHQLCQKTRALD